MEKKIEKAIGGLNESQPCVFIQELMTSVILENESYLVLPFSNRTVYELKFKTAKEAAHFITLNNKLWLEQ